MIGEIIAIGDELTSGRILNSTSNFAAHQLFAAGHEIVAMATIGDEPELIGTALLEALARADFVLVTGGLGPTSDDLTNEAVARALNRPSTFHPEILERIQAYLAREGTRGEIGGGISLEKLAWLPEGAEVLKPDKSMAGYLLVQQDKPIFFLPGIPSQMRELLTDCVIPRLAAWQGGESRRTLLRVYRIFGLAESEVNRRLARLEKENSLIRLGYYPVFPEVHLSLTVLGSSQEETDSLFHLFEGRIMEAVGGHVFGRDHETMASVVVALLRERGLTLALAESCTGGLASHLVTSVPGSSEVFRGGVVAYSNDVKIDLLGVDESILHEHGAVSAATARAMAIGVRERTRADLAVAITGIAGPGGGSVEKPVGTVHFGVSDAVSTHSRQRWFDGDRQAVQALSAMTALDLVRRKLLD